jgi:AcrR family transcriptional regulator
MTPGPARHERPALPGRSPRVAAVVAAAHTVLERDGIDGLTMHAVAGELGIKAPSLYKHVAGKHVIEVELLVDSLLAMGEALHAALDDDPPRGAAATDPQDRVTALLAAYRRRALAAPHLYRLSTRSGLPRADLPPGLEDWAGRPFGLVAGDPYRGQALWAFAHGMVVLEIDARFADATRLDTTWAEGAAAFAARLPAPAPGPAPAPAPA